MGRGERRLALLKDAADFARRAATMRKCTREIRPSTAGKTRREREREKIPEPAAAAGMTSTRYFPRA